MDVNLGRCHFGGDDVATMTAVRVAGTGWIAVCERHRERAEADGFEVRAPTPVRKAVSPSSPAPSERRVVVGALSLGCCHYGCTVATMTATRQGASGWIAVCVDHRARAEEDGYVVREIADVTVAPPTFNEASGTEGAAAPTAALPAVVETLRRALDADADDDDSGLDIFEGTLDRP